MKTGGFRFSTLDNMLKWARASSLWYMSTGKGCCADEMFWASGPRYDLERFGCVPQVDPRQADLLIITGAISYKVAAHLRSLYDLMLAPKYVMSLGSCATCGGPFAPEFSYSIIPGADRIVPVDIYVPGCPPRPEAIMDGLITLQGKIRGHQRTHPQA